MMRKPIKYILLIITWIVCSIYGVIIHKYKIFPYGSIKTVYIQLKHDSNDIVPQNAYGPWSIGIYEGPTPFDLSPPENISNPVLTWMNITDRDAKFVADPFMVFEDEKYFMFFEMLNLNTKQGDIAYAESADGKNWNYRKVVIDEKFHLSYPYVFKWENNYYMIPESHRDFSVRLYKAKKFPEEWEYVGNLLSGYRNVDPSIFRYKDKWWMFVSTGDNEILNLFFSDNLFKGWQPHPKNPIVKLDKHFSRSGGRVIHYNGNLFRLAQDDDPSYGIQVFAFEITELSETSYAEKLASKKPIVTKTNIGWNAAGMHNVDPQKIGNKWIAVVDGRNR